MEKTQLGGEHGQTAQQCHWGPGEGQEKALEGWEKFGVHSGGELYVVANRC